ncbi:hypothetical protein PLESTB_000877500 [Pleodorina starrii]|uniref:Major capsid protein n=1 Tax=Pleodorina starrii TaxID=330485 RepID=A0A9W6F3K6_9CHLO|nr:hypothetical protein PLESTB_000877500 [Pleodorina starrii]
MGGGLMQLVAYGAQDIYLTGNPQITFFKSMYRRYTNFAIECIEQTFNGAADWGRKVTCAISRNGDLINRMYLRVLLPDVKVPKGHAFRWLDWIGHILIKSVEIEIGGQRIDRHFGDWLHIWNELTQTSGHSLGYANMVGNTAELTSITTTDTTASDLSVKKGDVLYIPLQFWFCKSISMSLPLIALQYHECKVNIDLREARECYWYAKVKGTNSTTGAVEYGPADEPIVIPSLTSSLYVDYIYLDTDERKRFAQTSHEYLIDQLQFTGDESTSQTNNKLKLNFNHPVKSLFWVVQPDDHVMDPPVDSSTGKFTKYKLGRQWFNYTDAEDTPFDAMTVDTVAGAVAAGGNQRTYIEVFSGGRNPTREARLQLNGHDRMDTRDSKYWNCVQPYQYFENVPSKGINIYSFAVKPADAQPSGTCNFSRIDNAILNLTLTEDAVKNNRSCKPQGRLHLCGLQH